MKPIIHYLFSFFCLLFAFDVQAMPPGSGVLYFVHNDASGTPQALSDESGNVVWKAETDPFGAANVDEDPDGDGKNIEFNVRFPGQYYDQETGLHYNYFRYYDPELGRYLTADPVGQLGDLNLYRYADGNPIRLSDPLGLYAYDIHYEMTYRATGDSDLSYQVANVDFEPGSQLDGMAHWHAMRPPWRTPKEGAEYYYRHLNNQINKCTKEGLARAVHAVQDSSAGGHKEFQIWNGGGIFGLPSWEHIKADAYPDNDQWQKGMADTKEILRRFREKCECK